MNGVTTYQDSSRREDIKGHSPRKKIRSFKPKAKLGAMIVVAAKPKIKPGKK